MGERIYKPPRLGDTSLSEFHKRIREIMEQPVGIDVETQQLMLASLPLDAAAKKAWIEYHDMVEQLLAYGADYHSIRDIASKIAENAARIAACLQWFMKLRSTCVEEWAMLAGIEIAKYYLAEHRRLNGDLAAPPAVESAIELEQFLAKQMLDRETNRYDLAQICRFGPSCVRKSADRDEALEVLKELNRAHVEKIGQSEKRMVFLHPDVLKAHRE
jgi:putative DNA primase/helicase